MTTANVQIRKILVGRGNTAVSSNYLGTRGEITMDTDLKTLRIHDGTTRGGTRLAKYSDLSGGGGGGATGPQGIQGNVGPQGPQGIQGIQGNVGPQGIQGNVGAQGPQGIQGATGSQGIQGIQGTQGNTGAQGISVTLRGNVASPAALPSPGTAGDGYIVDSTGNLWFWNSTITAWADIGKIVGPEGPRGPQGIQGATGSQGIQGIQGNVGPQGPQGIQGNIGPKGDQGAQGIQGNVGPQGPAGAAGSAANTGDIAFENSNISSSTDSTIRVTTNSNNWAFGANGTLTLPDGSTVINGFIAGAAGQAGGISNGGAGYQQVFAQDPGVWIQTSANNAGESFSSWIFDLTGNLALPQTNIHASPAPTSWPGITFSDSTFQNTAWKGTVANLDNNGYRAHLDTSGVLSVSNRIASSGGSGPYLNIGPDYANSNRDWSFYTSLSSSILNIPYSDNQNQGLLNFQGYAGSSQISYDGGGGYTSTPYPLSFTVSSTANVNVIGSNVSIKGGRTGTYDQGNEFQLATGGYSGPGGTPAGFTFIGGQYTNYEFVQSSATSGFTALALNNTVISADSFQGGQTVPVARTSFVMQAGNKYVFQMKLNRISLGQGSNTIGVVTLAADFTNGIGNAPANSVGFDAFGYYNNGTDYPSSPQFVPGDIVAVAVDRVSNLIWLRTFNNSGGMAWNNNPLADPATGVGGYTLPDFGSADIYPAVTPTNLNTYVDRSWTFGADGNLTIAGNINYANGRSILSGITGGSSDRITTDTHSVIVGNDNLVLSNVQYIYPSAVGKDIDIYTASDYSSELWLHDNGPAQIITNGGTYTWNFSNIGDLKFPNNSKFDGQTLTDHATGVNYTLKIANGNSTGSKFGIGTGSAAFGIANDALNHAEDGYVPYSLTASRINLTVLGSGSWVFDNAGGLTFPDATVQTTAWQGNVAIIGTAGGDRLNGTLWYDTVDGRLYVRYSGQWVDANPTIAPPSSYYLGNLTIDNETINFTYGNLTIDNSGNLLVNGNLVTGSGGGSGSTDRGIIYTAPAIGGLVFANVNSASNGSLKVINGGYMTAATSSGFTATVTSRNRLVLTNADSTLSAGNDIYLTANLETGAQSWKFSSNGSLGLPQPGQVTNNGQLWSFRDDGVLATPSGIYVPSGDTSLGLTFSPDRTSTVGRISVDTGNNMTVNSTGAYSVKVSSYDRVYISTNTTTLIAGQDVVFKSNKNTSEYVMTLNQSGNLIIPGNINYANGVNILSTVTAGASTGNITFTGSNITGTGTTVVLTAGSTDYTFYPNSSLALPNAVENCNSEIYTTNNGYQTRFETFNTGTGRGTGQKLTLDYDDGSVKIQSYSYPNTVEWKFGQYGDLVLPNGGVISESTGNLSLRPPTATIGQSLVIRPTASFNLSASGYIVPGQNLTITLTNTNNAALDNTYLNYTITGALASQLGLTSLTGHFPYLSPSATNPQSASIVLPIPLNSSALTFTLTIDGDQPAGSAYTTITVTNNGIFNYELSHVHLVAGDPSVVDLYLGDDDQYVKIEKNHGNVVIGTNSNTNHWTFGTDGNTTLPGGLTIGGSVPGTLTGSAGDRVGMVRMDANYIYYCTANWTSPDYITGAAQQYVNTTYYVYKGSYPQPQIGWTFVSAYYGTQTVTGVIDGADLGWGIQVDGVIANNGTVQTDSNIQFHDPSPPAIWTRTLTLTSLKTVVAASSDFADFKSRIAAL